MSEAGSTDRSLPRVRGVLLDIDDTLLDTRSAFVTAIDAVADAYLPHLTTAERTQALGVWRADTRGFYRRHTTGELTADEQRRLRAVELHERFGGPAVDEAFYPEWNATFRAGFEAGWVLHRDVAGLLTWLAGTDLAVGLLTNAPLALTRRKLERTGLGDDVRLLLTLDTFGFGKPDARVFLEGCRLLGTSPGETLYVGDELDVDGLGASGAGLQAVWLDRPGARRGGVHLEDPAVAREAGVAVVRGLDELPALLEAV